MKRRHLFIGVWLGALLAVARVSVAADQPRQPDNPPIALVQGAMLASAIAAGIDKSYPSISPALVAPNIVAASGFRAELAQAIPKVHGEISALLKKVRPRVQPNAIPDAAAAVEPNANPEVAVMMELRMLVIRVQTETPKFSRQLEAVRDTLAQFDDEVTAARRGLPPRRLIWVAAAGRWGEDKPGYALDVTHSDVVRGIDVTAQGAVGEPDGVGVAGRADLSASQRRFRRAVEDAYSAIDGIIAKLERARKEVDAAARSVRHARDLPAPSPDRRDELVEWLKQIAQDLHDASEQHLREASKLLGEAGDELNSLRESNDQLIDVLVEGAVRPRVAATVAHSQLVSVGNISLAALSASLLLPLSRERPNTAGITPLVSAQFIDTDPNGAPNRAAVRFGGGVTWQDRVPHAYTVEDYGESVRAISRWRWRVGMEFNARTRLDLANGLVGFVIYRYEPGAYGAVTSAGEGRSLRDLYERFLDITLFGGRGTDAAAFAGIRLSRPL